MIIRKSSDKPETAAVPPASPVAVRPKAGMANAGWNAFGTACSILISFFSAPVLIRALGTSDYGLLLLVGSITGVLGVMSFGLGEATLRYVAHYHADRDIEGVNRVFGSTLSFYMMICTVVLVLMFSAAPIVVTWMNIQADQHDMVAWLMRLSAVSFSLGTISSAFAVIPAALQRYDICNKIAVVVNIARTGGYLALALAGFGLVHLILWDLTLGSAVLCLYIAVMRRLLPEAKLLPSFSFGGLREVFGYSVLVFATNILHSFWRESGKFIVARYSGPSGVAYLGTPDNVAYRMYMVVVSGVETLLPRFSAIRDAKAARSLLLTSTWAAVAVAVVAFVPLAGLMPDLLSLWIRPEFALEGGRVGTFIALSFVGSAAYAPIAAYLRGIGKPGAVTTVMAFAAFGVTILSVLLVPRNGALGVAQAYLLTSAVYFVGTFASWCYAFGVRSMWSVVRSVGLPVVVGGAMFVLEEAVLAHLGGPPTWPRLFLTGGLFVSVTAAFVAVGDLVLGGESVSRDLLRQVVASRRVEALLIRFSRREAVSSSS